MSKNLLFPGLERYEGPSHGIFALLHHTILCEYSDDVMERVTFVRHYKASHEIDTRLRHMIYVGDLEASHKFLEIKEKEQDELMEEYRKFRDSLKKIEFTCIDVWNPEVFKKREFADLSAQNEYDEIKRELFKKFGEELSPYRAEILGFIRENISDCKWDEEKKTLMFPDPDDEGE